MKILNKDIFDVHEDGEVLCVTSNACLKGNGDAVMGKGVALLFANKFPKLKTRLGLYLKEYSNRCFNLGKYNYKSNGNKFVVTVASFPTKHNWADNADINLIRKSATEIKDMADKFDWTNIYIPAPGVGLGKLDWECVQPVLEEILDDRFTILFKD